MAERTYRVYLGLGSNLGDRRGNIERALSLIAEGSAVSGMEASPFYETAPVGKEDQPAFLNACAGLDTTERPSALMERLLSIEKKMGRVRNERWGPRIIDLDILLYDDLVLEEKRIKIPHPQMHRRFFVLVPLCDLAAERIHPVFGRPLAELLADLGPLTGVVKDKTGAGS